MGEGLPGGAPPDHVLIAFGSGDFYRLPGPENGVGGAASRQVVPNADGLSTSLWYAGSPEQVRRFIDDGT
jgi:hypothetical protein